MIIGHPLSEAKQTLRRYRQLATMSKRTDSESAELRSLAREINSWMPPSPIARLFESYKSGALTLSEFIKALEVKHDQP